MVHSKVNVTIPKYSSVSCARSSNNGGIRGVRKTAKQYQTMHNRYFEYFMGGKLVKLILGKRFANNRCAGSCRTEHLLRSVVHT